MQPSAPMPRPPGIALAAAPTGSSLVTLFMRHSRSPAKLVLLLAAATILIGAQQLTGSHGTSYGINVSAPSIAPMELMKAAGPLPETKIADYV